MSESAPLYLEPLYTADEMRAAEALYPGYPETAHELMERAGAQTARAALELFAGAQRWTVVCGGGSNGGDPPVAAVRAAAADDGPALRPGEELERGACRLRARALHQLVRGLRVAGIQRLRGAHLVRRVQ